MQFGHGKPYASVEAATKAAEKWTKDGRSRARTNVNQHVYTCQRLWSVVSTQHTCVRARTSRRGPHRDEPVPREERLAGKLGGEAGLQGQGMSEATRCDASRTCGGTHDRGSSFAPRRWGARSVVGKLVAAATRSWCDQRRTAPSSGSSLQRQSAHSVTSGIPLVRTHCFSMAAIALCVSVVLHHVVNELARVVAAAARYYGGHRHISKASSYELARVVTAQARGSSLQLLFPL